MKQPLLVLVLLVFFWSSTSAQNVCSRFRAVRGRCDLNAAPVEQAKCLLRPVKKFGNLGEPLGELPAPLDMLVGEPTVTATIEQVHFLLAANEISEADVGGPLSVPLTKAKYFVIHDTSDFLEANEFPENINTSSSSLNTLSSRVKKKVAHIYINRLGKSATAVAFESPTPPSGTKLGKCKRVPRSAFIHVENIQPRIRDRAVRFPNDALAPEPGFSNRQSERLAIVYVVASARAGKWLIPAFHSPLDLGFPDRHDDPQNFNLERWAMDVQVIVSILGSMVSNDK
jgi:hypothetical protein